MNKRIEINLLSKDRPNELYGLLISLRNQTYTDWDLTILDDASGNPYLNHHFIAVIVNRLKAEGHKVTFLRSQISKGISVGRQKIVDHCLKNSECDLFARLDDDTVLEPDYLSKLIEVIEKGYDLASGVTPPFGNPICARSVEFVSPIINRVVLDDEGNFLVNCDDCGNTYLEEAILPTHHFRSACICKREVYEKVRYEENLTPCGFREEEFFSFRMILEGFTLGVHTQAVMWHVQTPSGGDRRGDYQNLSVQNQIMLNKQVKKWYKKHGNFIKTYNEKIGIDESKALESLNKNNNLIYYRGEE